MLNLDPQDSIFTADSGAVVDDDVTVMRQHIRTALARLCTKIAQVHAQKIPLAATSSRACSRRKMIPRKSPIPCHRFRWNLDHPQIRHTKIYNNQLFNYQIYLPNSAGPKIRATVQPHFLNSTLCIE